MPAFVVERYVQASGLEALIRRERQALDGGATDGVRHLRSTYVPDDELFLSFYEGTSMDAVRRLNERAGLPFERISEAIDVAGVEPAIPDRARMDVGLDQVDGVENRNFNGGCG